MSLDTLYTTYALFCMQPGLMRRLGVQVYINGEFVGGADIVEEMHTSGDLKRELAT